MKTIPREAILVAVFGMACVAFEGRPVRAKDTPTTQPNTTQPTAKKSRVLTLDLGGGVKMELALIPAGEFMMGSPEREKDHDSSEGPQHRVRISQPFYLGKTEVTQAQWTAVMGNNPSNFKGSTDLPVEQVSWDDCQEFCRKLSQRVGREIRLPTEAEWEYACRAGTTTAYSFGSDASRLGEYAWYTDNSAVQTHPVGRKRANRWGLYDMHGNVEEWCADWWVDPYPSGSQQVNPTGPTSGDTRVFRGGNWDNYAFRLRSAYRDGNKPALGFLWVGFRVAAGT